MYVIAAPAELRYAALQLLFRNVPEEAREESIQEALSGAGDGELSLDGLLVALEADQLRGAVLYVMQPDKTAFIWSPIAVDSVTSAAQIEDELLAELTRRIRSEQAWIGQCIIEPHEIEARLTLTRNGFPTVTELDFLSLDLTSVELAELAPPDPRLTSVEFSNETYSRFAAVIEQTYIETLDCPLLSEHRTVDEAISSHMTSGKFEPSRWKLFSANGKDVGVLLLSEYPEQEAWEVVYTGVVASARGQGFGLAIINAGIRDAFQQRTNGVFLAVDTKNTAAQNIYEAVGFAPVATRAVHGQFF